VDLSDYSERGLTRSLEYIVLVIIPIESILTDSYSGGPSLGGVEENASETGYSGAAAGAAMAPDCG
jgi:hypothetical protein